jgi:hypothetical protein
MCLFEIYSGRLATGRTDKSGFSVFDRDVRSAIVSKARQLNWSIKTVLDAEHRLTGYPRTAGLRLIPIIIITDGFPLFRWSYQYALRKLLPLSDFRLLSHERVLPIAIIDVQDISVMEGLSSRGISVASVLGEWLGTGSQDTPLRIFINQAFPDWRGYPSVSERAIQNIDRIYNEMMEIASSSP